MIVLESLQMAQMVADLSALEAARKERARALLQANKEAEAEAAAAAAAAASAPATSASEVPPPTTADDPPRSSANHHGVPATSALASASANGTASPFDSYLGRFLTPALTRTNSSHGTGLNTPQSQSQNQNSTHAGDVDRASSMVALNELRAKLKQYNDSASLRQAREKVAALSAQRQAGEHVAPTSNPAATQHPPLARRSSHFTFPRE